MHTLCSTDCGLLHHRSTHFHDFTLNFTLEIKNKIGAEGFLVKMRKLFIRIIPLFFTAFLAGKTGYSAPLGDRLILTINGIPYSQLQIEGYLDVKESLRDNPGKSQLVSADNWNVALASFIKDMTLYQEANRTSGFRASRELVAKATEKVQKVIETNDRFKKRFDELGFETLTIREYIAHILSIENLRRSRASMQNAKGGGKTAPSTDWEDELMKRALIRWFEHGKTYENLALNTK